MWLVKVELKEKVLLVTWGKKANAKEKIKITARVIFDAGGWKEICYYQNGMHIDIQARRMSWSRK